MATKVTGLGDNYYISGYDVSGATNSLSKISGSFNPLDFTDITQSAHARLPGLREGSIDFVSYLDTTSTTGAHALYSQLQTTDLISSYFVAAGGMAVGNPAACMTAKQLNYDFTRQADGMLTANVSLVSNGFGLEWGNMLTPGHYLSPNFLTGTNSTFEVSAGNWTGDGNTSTAQSNAQAHGGTNSLSLTSVGAGNMNAFSCTAGNIATQGFAVVPGQNVVVSGWVRTAVSARSVNTEVGWYTSGGALISTTHGSNVTDSTSAWTFVSATLTAPATAAFGRAGVQVLSAGGASEVHYIDDIQVIVLPTSYDSGGSLSFGAQAYLQVFAFTGTDATITIQDSADNVTFTNVSGLGFTQITSAPQAQRIATSNSATIREYLQAAVTTVGGFTALEFAVVIVKNQTAGVSF